MNKQSAERVTVPLISQYKNSNRKISALTAYDYTFARLIDHAGVDLILVGDSLGCIVKGEHNTLSVTMEEMLYHCRCVTRAVSRALVVGDLPFMSYQVSVEQALRNAGRLIQEGGVAAVKLEGGVFMTETIRRLVQIDIPVVGHVGLTPQSYHRMGGHKLQGKAQSKVAINNTAGTAERILADALAVEEAGAFALVIEGVSPELAAQITKSVSIPTIGIAAGDTCDGQIMVSTDLLNLNPESLPKFVQPLANLGEQSLQAFKMFANKLSGTESSENKVSNKLAVNESEVFHV